MRNRDQVEDPPLEATATPEGDLRIAFHQPINYDRVDSIWREVSGLVTRTSPKRVLLDFGGAGTIDSAGIAFLRVLERYCHSRGIELEHVAVPSSLQHLLKYSEISAAAPHPTASQPPLDIISQLGKVLAGLLDDLYDLTQFIGLFSTTLLENVLHPERLRWKETFFFLQLSGAESVPIIILLSFLMGLVLGFQASIQLRQFGANIYVADLVGLSIIRELGPLLTAIIMAGRSGSAFAAEIGTMKVNEEVDALKVMGFNVTEFLVVPKVVALTIAGPLLTILSDTAGVLGGMVVAVTAMDLTYSSFMDETYAALTIQDLLSGLIKSVVFAFLIALIGCFRGLRTEEAAESVGRQTTSAVVSGIFLIIVFDAIFTVIFQVFNF